MSDRSYSGPPIDLAWESGPWAGEGETVKVVGGGTEGSVSVTGIEDVSELTTKQLGEVIRQLRHRDCEYADIEAKLGVSKRTIADASFGRGQFEGVDFATPPLQNEGRPVLSGEQVVEARQRLLRGASVQGIADDYPVAQSTLRRYVRGDKTVDPADPPALVYDHASGWSLPSDVSQGSDGSETDESSPAVDVGFKIGRTTYHYLTEDGEQTLCDKSSASAPDTTDNALIRTVESDVADDLTLCSDCHTRRKYGGTKAELADRVRDAFGLDGSGMHFDKEDLVALLATAEEMEVEA